MNTLNRWTLTKKLPFLTLHSKFYNINWQLFASAAKAQSSQLYKRNIRVGIFCFYCAGRDSIPFNMMLETSSQDKQALATVMYIYVNYQAMEKSHHDDQEWHTQSTLIYKNADTCLPIFPLRIKREITRLLLHCPQETKLRHSSFLAITLSCFPPLSWS